MGTEAKRFKNFDKQYARFRRNNAVEIGQLAVAAREAGITRWPYKPLQWTTDQIKFAVYDAPDFEQWQIFRVSLKGLGTPTKLMLLGERWDFKVSPGWGDIEKWPSQYALEQCRIDNYIGALRRGGLLDVEFKVVDR